MNPAFPADESPRVALLFPGQGSQFPGMGADLAAHSAKAKAVFERADEVLGYSLSQIMWGDDQAALQRTVHTQPAIFVHSMALFEALNERCELNPVAAGGHSLGEYTALCAAGALDFDEALDIIRVRATSMDQAQPAGTCGMAALIGPNADEARNMVESCRQDQELEAANFNAPDQVVVSGHLEAVQRVMEKAKSRPRTRVAALPVSSAFHTKLMAPARQALAERLKTATVRELRFPVVANATGQSYKADEIALLMVEQVVSPVRWVDCINTMMELGANLFVEVGPGKVLTGLLKRIDRKAASMNISDLPSIDEYAEAIR